MPPGFERRGRGRRGRVETPDAGRGRRRSGERHGVAELKARSVSDRRPGASSRRRPGAVCDGNWLDKAGRRGVAKARPGLSGRSHPHLRVCGLRRSSAVGPHGHATLLMRPPYDAFIEQDLDAVGGPTAARSATTSSRARRPLFADATDTSSCWAFRCWPLGFHARHGIVGGNDGRRVAASRCRWRIRSRRVCHFYCFITRINGDLPLRSRRAFRAAVGAWSRGLRRLQRGRCRTRRPPSRFATVSTIARECGRRQYGFGEGGESSAATRRLGLIEALLLRSTLDARRGPRWCWGPAAARALWCRP